MSRAGAAYDAASDDVAELLSQVDAYAPEADSSGRYSRDLVRRAGALGLFAAAVAPEHGGLGWDELSVGRLHEAAGRACTAFRSLLTVQGIVCRALQRWGSADQQALWLGRLATGELCGAFCATEEAAGSDLTAVQATAHACAGDYIVNGRKLWVTFGASAEVYLVLLQIDGRPSVLLVPRSAAGVSVAPTAGLLGLRGAEVATVSFVDVRVPQEALIGRPGAGLFAVVGSALDFGRYSVAWGALGLTARCLQEMLAHAATRRTFGARLLDHQLVRAHISDTAAELRVLQAFCKSVADSRDRGARHAVTDTSVAKMSASRLAMTGSWRAAQVLGARGVTGPGPVERFFRDAKVLEIIEGSHEIHRNMLAEFGNQVVRLE